MKMKPQKKKWMEISDAAHLGLSRLKVEGRFTTFDQTIVALCKEKGAL